MNIRMLAVGTIVVTALAGCATTSPGYGGGGYSGGGYSSAPASSRYCAECGIVGAVAGREISQQTGGSDGNKNVSTAAGAVAGAVAGNAIQKRTTGDTYNLTVRMDDGRRVVINQHDLGGIRENTYVRIQNGKVVLR